MNGYTLTVERTGTASWHWKLRLPRELEGLPLSIDGHAFTRWGAERQGRRAYRKDVRPVERYDVDLRAVS